MRGVPRRPQTSPELWEQIKRKAEKASAPTAIHHDLDLVLRTIRDVLSPESERVGRLGRSVPAHRRVPRSDPAESSLARAPLPAREPIFDDFSIEGEIAKALKSKAG